MNKIFILLGLYFSSSLSFGQENNYFQQEVNFDISVSFSETNYSLSAFETIEYTNNSNTPLDTLYFHIWPNAYKDLETEFANEKISIKDKEYILHQEYYKGYIDSLNFKINNKDVHFYLHQDHKDIAIIVLNKSIQPKETVTISTPFYVKLPRSISRLGYAKQSIQVSQWFPKPAVYDAEGWHYFPYRDMGEFYSEYGSYLVKIELPEAYILGATGNRIKTVIKDSTKIYTYSEKNIHDFAWFADVNFQIDIDSVLLPHSSKWVKTITYYNPSESKTWEKANKYVQDAVYYYSLWLGDYPYKTCKAVLSELGAGGGMEYPTITVIGGGFDDFSLENVIMHEVGHNWFYGLLGSNERTYPWMDEGLNSAYESRYVETKYPNRVNKSIPIKRFKYKYNKTDYYSYMLSASRNIDQAGNLSSEQYNMINYGTIVYKKDAAIINYLRHYLGDEEFDRIMKIYYETWKYKHPQPIDFKNIFKENTEKDLSWFFDDLLSSRKKMDYKIKSLKKDNEDYILSIRNKKQVSSPIFIQLFQKDSLVQEIISDGFLKDSTYTLSIPFDKIFLDKNYKSLDYNRNNNFAKRKGLCKKTEGLKLEFAGGFTKENKTQIYYSPVLGYNTTNEFMLGLAFMSNLVFPPQFEYLIMPMYSFGNKQISGETDFQFHFDSNTNRIKQVSPFISSKSYGLSSSQNYFQIQSGVNIDFRNFLVSNPTIQNLKIYYTIANQYYNYKEYNQFVNIEYKAENQRWYNPFKIQGKLNFHKDFALISAEYKQELTYAKPHTGLKIRLFSGVFIFNNSNNGQYNLSLSGTSGANDYLYEETFVGRNDIGYENLWTHQFIANEGGFTTYAPFSSNQWMSSLTISSTLPFKTPFELYFSLAAFEGSNQFFEKGLAWETGLAVNLIRDIAIIYFPFTADKQIQETNALYTEKYVERIRFTLLLNKGNIRKLTKNIDQFF